MESDIDDSFLGVVAFAINKHIKVTEDQVSKIHQTIIDLAGGDVVYISKQYNQKLSVRNNQLKRDHASGVHKSYLEIKYSLSRHQINRILKA